ncbi:hypothetical protein HY642_07295 [Candidatus Woesearchaeota archaeon]|nr:hypothetical protein [Candidatus Woesearchaeota archaeon]
MKQLLFDAGPVISLTTNNLLWVLEPLRDRFKGEFAITQGVREELVKRPLQTRKFKFEALQVEQLIETGILKVIESEVVQSRGRILGDLANRSFWVRNTPYRIVQTGEMETLAAAKDPDAAGVVVDERITRMLIEEPRKLPKLFSKRLHSQVRIDENSLREFAAVTKGTKLIRSAELLAVAYELGILDKYIVHVPKAREELLTSILWGVKLHGCAIGEEEIGDLVRLARATP